MGGFKIFIEGIGNFFVGSGGCVIEVHGAVWIFDVGKFIAMGFEHFPVCVLVMFVVSRCVYALFPELLFVFSE